MGKGLKTKRKKIWGVHSELTSGIKIREGPEVSSQSSLREVGTE